MNALDTNILLYARDPRGCSPRRGLFVCHPIESLAVRDLFASPIRSRSGMPSYWQLALDADVSNLYTEDLQRGAIIDGVRVVNPFK
jgi:predicted nucleic acid-binding protein